MELQRFSAAYQETNGFDCRVVHFRKHRWNSIKVDGSILDDLFIGVDRPFL
jgi:hypothetical protein